MFEIENGLFNWIMRIKIFGVLVGVRIDSTRWDCRPNRLTAYVMRKNGKKRIIRIGGK